MPAGKVGRVTSHVLLVTVSVATTAHYTLPTCPPLPPHTALIACNFVHCSCVCVCSVRMRERNGAHMYVCAYWMAVFVFILRKTSTIILSRLWLYWLCLM